MRRLHTTPPAAAFQFWDAETVRLGYTPEAGLDFYRGRQWPGRAGRSEKHLTLNYAKVVIDKVTSSDLKTTPATSRI